MITDKVLYGCTDTILNHDLPLKGINLVEIDALEIFGTDTIPGPDPDPTNTPSPTSTSPSPTATYTPPTEVIPEAIYNVIKRESLAPNSDVEHPRRA